MQKVLGTENPADMNTKGLNSEQIDKFTKMLRMEHRSGRADLAPEMHKLLHKGICERFNSTSAMITKRPRRGKTENSNKSKMNFEEKCIAGIESWKCPCAEKCQCKNNVMFCDFSIRYGNASGAVGNQDHK